jgi:hypothetical protein
MMNHDTVVDECRQAFVDGAPAWPAGLIRFLDKPPDMQRVFAWAIRCTRRLLVILGEFTPSLNEQLAMLESYVKECVDIVVIRETLERLWVQRSPHETAKTAVAQLFGSLIRYREGDTYRHLCCTVSITMLVDATKNREDMLEVVLKDFGSFVSEGVAEQSTTAERPLE